MACTLYPGQITSGQGKRLATTRSRIPHARFSRVFASKMSDLRCCRFSLETIPSKHAANILFFKNSDSTNLSARLSDLVQLPGLPSDGLSPYTCRLYRDRLLSMERKLAKVRGLPKPCIIVHMDRHRQAGPPHVLSRNQRKPVGMLEYHQ